MSGAKPKRASKPKAAPVEIVSIKGFDKDMRCRGFQFAVGETYEYGGPVVQCSSGFHACPVEHHPFSVFDYYAPNQSRYFQVRQSGPTSNGGNKLASGKITIDFELSLGDLVLRAWEYVWSRITMEPRGSATGTRGGAQATGYQGGAQATGTRGGATSVGIEGWVCGAEGNALFAIERRSNGDILSVAAGIVGRDGIVAGVRYMARGGKLVAA